MGNKIGWDVCLACVELAVCERTELGLVCWPG